MIGSIYPVNGRTYRTTVVFNLRGELVGRRAKIMPAGEKWAAPGNHIALFEVERFPSTVIIYRDRR